MHDCVVPIGTESCADYVSRHYRTIQTIVGEVARRHGLTHDESDELRSRLHLRLVQNNYALVRQFRGQCSFSTYLRTVVERLRMDFQTSTWGRWRPSRRAEDLGPVAVQLDQLLSRDRLPFDAACEVLRTNLRVTATRPELDALRARLPVRAQPRWMVSLDEPLAEQYLADRRTPAEREDTGTGRALSRALASLPARDRRLLHLRFQGRRTIARIAREHGLDQKSLYRRFDGIYKRLRTTMMSERCEHGAESRARAAR